MHLAQNINTSKHVIYLFHENTTEIAAAGPSQGSFAVNKTHYSNKEIFLSYPFL